MIKILKTYPEKIVRHLPVSAVHCYFASHELAVAAV
jgi:hypothetical protein